MTFSGGGPMYIPKIYDGHNKTFYNRTVPTPAWRSGNFSEVAEESVARRLRRGVRPRAELLMNNTLNHPQ